PWRRVSRTGCGRSRRSASRGSGGSGPGGSASRGAGPTSPDGTGLCGDVLEYGEHRPDGNTRTAAREVALRAAVVVGRPRHVDVRPLDAFGHELGQEQP